MSVFGPVPARSRYAGRTTLTFPRACGAVLRACLAMAVGPWRLSPLAVSPAQVIDDALPQGAQRCPTRGLRRDEYPREVVADDRRLPPQDGQLMLWAKTPREQELVADPEVDAPR